MAANQSNLATTFTAPPVGSLVDQSGMASQRFLIWLNALFKRFLILRGNLVPISSNYAINLSDCTLQCVLTQPNPIILTLPPSQQIQGQIFIVKNDATSVSTVSFLASNNALIDNAAPSSVVLFPGQSIILECDGVNWIKLAVSGGSGSGSSTPSGLTATAFFPGGFTTDPGIGATTFYNMTFVNGSLTAVS